jgi:glycosyltransferase involved in cell wall biosynthesis
VSKAAPDRPSALHVYRSPLLNESRIERGCGAVLTRYPGLQQIVVGVQTGGLPDVETTEGGLTFARFCPPPRSLLMRGPVRTRAWDLHVIGRFSDWDLRLVSAHSVGVLPMASRLARRRGVALLYEPHELESHTANTPRWQRVLARWVERRLLPACDGVVVVSDAIADWYARTYGMTRPVVVRNVPEVRGTWPARDPELWRARFGIPAGHLVFIYQGGLFAGRRVEQMVRVFGQARADRHVVFMGYGEREGLVRAAAARHGNIHYAPAVPPGEVLRHTAGADVGLVGVENVCLSYYYSLPNKLFEYVGAGLAVLMPDFPEMRQVVERTGCGWVVGESDEMWLTAVNGVEWAEVRVRQAKARAAADTYTWEREKERLLAVYARFPRLTQELTS